MPQRFLYAMLSLVWKSSGLCWSPRETVPGRPNPIKVYPSEYKSVACYEPPVSSAADHSRESSCPLLGAPVELNTKVWFSLREGKREIWKWAAQLLEAALGESLRLPVSTSSLPGLLENWSQPTA